MKRCSWCGLDRPLDEFAKRGNGHQGHCKPCNRTYQREHYIKNKSQYLSNAKDWKQQRKRSNHLAMRTYLAEHPCVDCGETDPVVLEFDHIDRTTKTASVSELLHTQSMERVLLEVAKCQVLCANCHRRKTAKQLGWYSVLASSSSSGQESSFSS